MAAESLESITGFIEWSESALHQLAANLTALGYEFKNEGGPIKLSESDASLLALEARFGELPAFYRAFYRRFQCVDFRQSDRQLQSKDSKVSGLGLNCPLVFCSLDRIESIRAELRESELPVESDGLHFLPTGSVASNCDPKGIWIPSVEPDPVLYNDGAGPISLTQEVRESVLAGGFPFWKTMFRRRQHCSPLGHSPPYPELLPQLLQGINPPP
jgi:hypothetical protein